MMASVTRYHSRCVSIRYESSFRTPLLQENGDINSDEGNNSPQDRDSDGSLRLLENGLGRNRGMVRRDCISSRGSSLNGVESRTLECAQDYRSEGDQPSTARDGARMPLGKISKQDSFRAARMPKRGGRRRLRRMQAVRRKIRVSSYCVARELQTLALLRWLETQPNRHLAQSLRAQGGSVPQGPVGSIKTGTSPRAAMPGTRTGAHVEDESDVSFATVGAKTPHHGLRGEIGPTSSRIGQLEWMDSLYIDIIHSTTDLQGALRKARELEQPAGAGTGGSDSSPYYYEADDDTRDRRAGGDGGDEDDDVLTHKDIMFFPYGAVVFWGCSETEVRTIGVIRLEEIASPGAVRPLCITRDWSLYSVAQA